MRRSSVGGGGGHRATEGGQSASILFDRSKSAYGIPNRAFTVRRRTRDGEKTRGCEEEPKAFREGADGKAKEQEGRRPGKHFERERERDERRTLALGDDARGTLATVISENVS